MKRMYYIAIAAVYCFLNNSCAPDRVVTYADFKEISADLTRPNFVMELSDVERIIGSKGTLSNGEYVDGIIVATSPGQDVYYWENKDGSNISISILNGRVTNIAENNLN